ncbi:hypothetical protein E2K73_06340 [Acinetobacter sp. RF15A]|uniref:hypothetical protein n=1 Tax=unclassified Acinetobacter TaxID=196816 RepID=UPI00118EE432|nr:MULTISPECIES: hypothetical protein [unclassified Acinetobacter]TSH75977.1 hypothetical protein E2K73_06340 [Acinetobacter sp. RF15A]TSI18073.1 hypothetical protein E2K74_08010 [Acinetobacter sp. RF15B]
MLEHWYSKHYTRQMKLVVVIIVCLLIYSASTVAQLGPISISFSVGIGLMSYGLRQLRFKIPTGHPYANGFAALSRVIPIVAMVTLWGYLPQHAQDWEKFALALQCLGFAAIGLFLASIYVKRARRCND